MSRYPVGGLTEGLEKLLEIAQPLDRKTFAKFLRQPLRQGWQGLAAVGGAGLALWLVLHDQAAHLPLDRAP